MIHIRPVGYFPIIRQVADASDSATYYVQAVIRDSVSGDTLATVNLTDQGAQRFTYNYPTPADPSGQGRYIDVTTTVYADSGYTTRTGVYADENATYLIKEDAQLGGGIGMGETVSYLEIRKIIKQELEKLELPTQEKPVDITPKLKALETVLRSEIQTAFASIRIPEQVKPDLDSVVSQVNTALDNAVNTLLIAVDNKEVTPETDITPVLQAIQELPINDMIQTLQGQSDEMERTLQTMVVTNDELQQLEQSTEQFVGNLNKNRTVKKVKQEDPQEMMKMRVQRLLGNRQMA
jgi:hypothetical protein